ncbi:MAG: EF-hand domain-containing protein [Planctomycetota bacterium JB042]
MNKLLAGLRPLPVPALVLLAFVAGRASAPTEDEADAPSLEETMREWFDADLDGRIDRYEAGATAMRLVDESDEDGDGALDDEELASAVRWIESEDYEETVRLLERCDADGDGRLTAEEVPAEESARFAFADADEDGALTREELNAAFEAWNEPTTFDVDEEVAAILEEYDADGDGRIDREEAVVDELAADVPCIDRDGDGVLTRDELARFVEMDGSPATFEVDGDVAVVAGTLDASTPSRVLRLLLEHPEVRTLELRWISGTVDDAANLWVMREVRRRGLVTRVPKGGMVASGGTDLLLAGVRRTVEPGARVGVHSWDGGSIEGRALPRDHEDHEEYLAICRELGVPEAYYWFTLEAAPAEEMHWATREELVRYGIVTEGVR